MYDIWSGFKTLLVLVFVGGMALGCGLLAFIKFVVERVSINWK